MVFLASVLALGSLYLFVTGILRGLQPLYIFFAAVLSGFAMLVSIYSVPYGPVKAVECSYGLVNRTDYLLVNGTNLTLLHEANYSLPLNSTCTYVRDVNWLGYGLSYISFFEFLASIIVLAVSIIAAAGRLLMRLFSR